MESRQISVIKSYHLSTASNSWSRCGWLLSPIRLA